MFVRVDKDFCATLEDEQNFRAFKLVVSDKIADPAELSARIPALVRTVEGDHAWLLQDKVEKLGPADADWVRQYRSMIAYAEAKGWVRGAPPEVAAHIEVQAD